MIQRRMRAGAAALKPVAASLFWSLLWISFSALLAMGAFLWTGSGQFFKTVQLCVSECSAGAQDKYIVSPESGFSDEFTCASGSSVVEFEYSRSTLEWFSGKPGSNELEDIRSVGEDCSISSISTKDSLRAGANDHFLTSSVLLPFVICLALLAIVVGIFRGAPIQRRVDFRFLISAVALGVLASVASGSVAVGPEEQQLIALASQGMNVAQTLLIYIVVLPFCEEIVFRFLVLEEWRRRSVSQLGLLMSSLWFAGAHIAVLSFSGGWVLLLFIFILGLLAGAAYLRNGLFGAFSVHATYNSVLFFVQATIHG